MATTPKLRWALQESSVAASDSGIGARGMRTALAATATATETALVSPEVPAAVAPPRLRRQASGSWMQQAGGNKKPPQRGLGVAELERLRCGGDPLRDLNAAVAAAAMGDAANVQGHPVLHHHLPTSAFDAATGARYISPLLVQPSPAPPSPPAPVCYVHSASAGVQSVAPEQRYFMDRWGRMGGFVPVGNAGSDHQPQLPSLAPEHPSSQSTIWRPASSSSCLHTGHRCDLCSRTMRALTERGARTPAAASTATTMPDYSIYDLAAAMTTARKEKGEGFLARERKKKEAVEKEVREIEFFSTSTTINAGGVGPDESESATMGSTPFPSSSGGGCTAPLDLSLRLYCCRDRSSLTARVPRVLASSLVSINHKWVLDA